MVAGNTDTYMGLALVFARPISLYHASYQCGYIRLLYLRPTLNTCEDGITMTKGVQRGGTGREEPGILSSNGMENYQGERVPG